ncbi:MAG: cyclase family protein [Acidimicrobiales bacterium]
MCLAETTDVVRHRHEHAQEHEHDRHAVSRRRFLGGGTALAAGVVATVAAPAVPATARPDPLRRVVDLTHRLRRDFPTFDDLQPVDEVIHDFDTSGYFAKRWEIPEHTGTHIDTPGHFNEGQRLVDDLLASELVVPIVVIDVAAKAMDDPNATVEPDDLIRFERRYGPIPPRALVCMDSGWAVKADDTDEYRGGPAYPDFNFPGFGIEATDWLVARRNAVGIGVDTLSLDPGNSTTFDVHHGFLGADRYGIENLNNLNRIPPQGAFTFVGAIPWEDGSGSPCRVLATW